MFLENNYYPFGLKHKGYNGSVSPLGNDVAQRWKFGGKELNDELNLDWYDVSARNYDPAIGRWMNLDPLAEQMRRHSPYNYAFDNPIYFTDPDGMAPDDFYDQNGKWLGASDKNYIVTNAEDIATIEANTNAGKNTTLSELGGHLEELPSQMVRSKMKDAVDRSNQPTTTSDNPDPNFVPDTAGGFHEEGGVAGLDWEGKETVREAYPGSKGDPNNAGVQASVNLNKGPNNDGSYFEAQLEFHVHPGGTDSVTGRGFNQKPSASVISPSGTLVKGDLSNSGSRREAVLSAGPADKGGQKAYFYQNGKITAEFPLQKLYSIPDPK
ncbi:RHS repeat-associated core domain-containing protein [uncultured Croceitalea sp.]|uniref:RHS repeat domain-containing protein n=1 Tax=uncultured Croceitalea sp. TaxID=1798908 RepID=UPI0033057154